ncbi:MAG: 2-amino-4-hydroxy-6-hydroxymethyldihydropteridine diphosphokinase [Anaerolineae bacterium]|nr:2-amino-4-hydroxy-6-hydroxymethyldihydropteridine diphosphokinase [Anaerolineae bacterium]MCB9108176.1 2-amino-4-hydroxy-6-hydroxymethyldihydropteridine diphosphokinase [Anaerolineales bacterium]
MPNIAYLSLGSNIEPETNLKSALRLLACYTDLLAVSSVWETKPVGLIDQPNFLNAAAIIATELAADQLKQQVLLKIESCLGRQRQVNKNAPRTIDIDIMFFNRQIFNLADRRIPDPEVLERPFVAIPLAEIAPDYVHPETGQNLQEIAHAFEIKADEMQLREDMTDLLTQFMNRTTVVSSTIKNPHLERKL